MANRILFAIVIGLITTSPAFAQVHIGVKAGGNISTMMFDVDSDYGEEPETKLKMGFHAGVIADITLLPNTLSLQPGVLFNNKGVSYDMEELLKDEYATVGAEVEDYEGFARLNYNYIEIPIHFVYKRKDLQVYAGPYVGIGISGSFKHDFSFEVNGEKIDGDDIFEKDSYKLKPVFGEVDDDEYRDFINDDDIFSLYRGLDAGINFGAGYQINRVLINAGYSLGLANVTPDFDTSIHLLDKDYSKNVIQRNRVITFSVSYFIN